MADLKKTKKHLNPNLNAQKNFIKKLINSGVKNFFIAGTCYEYGKGQDDYCI